MSLHNNILTCLAGDYDKQIKKIAIEKNASNRKPDQNVKAVVVKRC